PVLIFSGQGQVQRVGVVDQAVMAALFVGLIDNRGEVQTEIRVGRRQGGSELPAWAGGSTRRTRRTTRASRHAKRRRSTRPRAGDRPSATACRQAAGRPPPGEPAGRAAHAVSASTGRGPALTCSSARESRSQLPELSRAALQGIDSTVWLQIKTRSATARTARLTTARSTAGMNLRVFTAKR